MVRAGTFWPTAEQRALLRVAFGPAGAAEWRALRPRLDVDRLDPGSLALMPLVRRALLDAGEDDAEMPRLAGVARHAWTRTQLVLRHLPRLLGAIADAGVEAVLFGAAPRAVVTYEEPGLRAVDRLRLLVGPDDLDRAARAVLRAGWAGTYRGADVRAGNVMLGGLCRCVLASRLLPEFPPAPAGDRDLAYLQAGAVTRAYKGLELRCPGATDDLLLVLLDGAQPRRPPTIQWLIDAIVLLRRRSDELDWRRLLDGAYRRRGALRLRDALGYLDESDLAPVPGEVLHELSAQPATRRERVAHRARGRWWPVLDRLPEPTARYLRSAGDERLVDVLVDAWGLESRADLPRTLLSRAASRTVRTYRHDSASSRGSQPIAIDARATSQNRQRLAETP